MSDSVIADLLAGRWRDPETGAAVTVPIRSIAILPSLAGSEADLLKTRADGRKNLGKDPVKKSAEAKAPAAAAASAAPNGSGLAGKVNYVITLNGIEHRVTVAPEK